MFGLGGVEELTIDNGSGGVLLCSQANIITEVKSVSDELLSLAQATDLIHQAGRLVTVQTVRRWCRLGELRATRLGRDWVIRRADLDEFLKGGEGSEGSEVKKVDALAA